MEVIWLTHIIFLWIYFEGYISLFYNRNFPKLDTRDTHYPNFRWLHNFESNINAVLIDEQD